MVKCAKTYPFENLKPFKCKRLKWRPLEQRASGSAQRAQPPPSTLQAGARARSTEIVNSPFPAARPGFVSRTVSVPLRLTFSPLITPLSLVVPGAGPWSRLLDAMLLALSRSPVADLCPPLSSPRCTSHVVVTCSAAAASCFAFGFAGCCGRAILICFVPRFGYIKQLNTAYIKHVT